MKPHARRDAQAGFSLIELTVTMGVMVAILGVTAGLMADALRTATVTSETTEAQQSLRAAHEYLNRDLVITGDGLNGLRGIEVRLPVNFVNANITTDPNRVLPLNRNGVTTNYVAAPLVTSDDAETRSGTAAGLLAGSDRLTVMTTQPEPGFPVSVAGGSGGYAMPDTNTIAANVPGATASLFRPGEVVLVAAGAGGVSAATFAAVTSVGTGQIRFSSGDPYGLNGPNLPLLANVICGNGNPGGATCNGVTIQRVLLITYFVDDDGLLRRRVLGRPRRGGVSEANFAAAALAGDVVSEHITKFQVRYGLITPDRTGWLIVDRMTALQEPDVRQVEVELTAETPHPINHNGERGTATSVVRTSVRTMEYRNAL